MRNLNCEVTEIHIIIIIVIIIVIYHYSYQTVSDIASERSTKRSEHVRSTFRFTEVPVSTFSLLTIWVLGFFPGVMRPGRDVALSTAPSAEIKNMWSHTMLSWRGQEHLYLYPALSESCDSTFQIEHNLCLPHISHFMTVESPAIQSFIIYVSK